MKIEMRDVNSINPNKQNKSMLDIIGRTNKEIILDLCYKGEEISVKVRVHDDILYVLDKDYEKYMADNNEIFKKEFGNCPTFE
jgi:hypothetical protein